MARFLPFLFPFALFIGAAACRPASPSPSEVRTIYDEDNRFEVADGRVTPMAKQRSRSVGLLIHTRDVTFGADAKGARFADLAARPLGVKELCPNVRFRGQPSAGFCTGFLVGPKWVATAGHCLLSQADCAGTSFAFGYQFAAPNADPTRVPAKDVYACKTLLAHDLDAETGSDFALIELDRPVTDRPALALDHDDRQGLGQAVSLIGHPNGLPLKVSNGAYVTGFDPRKAYFAASLDAFHGNSGSPVFDSRTGVVEGILVRGIGDYVRDERAGCMVPIQCGGLNCPGSEVTRIGRLLNAL